MAPHLASAILVAVTLSGCALPAATPYATPPLALPGAWRHAVEPAAVEPAAVAAAAVAAPPGATPLARDGRWWRNFDDPALAALVDQALLRNNDLAAAALTVQRARLQAGLTERNALPQLSGSASAGSARSLRGGDPASRTYSAGLAVSYEVDLWGKLARQRDVAQWEAQASEQDRQSAALTLIGTTMTLYWKLGYLNQRIDLSVQSIAHAQQAANVARVKYGAGASAVLDVLQAEQALASQRADFEQLQHQREESRIALALLFDGPPGAVLAEPRDVPDGPYPAIAAGLPANLLARRPDLQAAELRLRQAFAGAEIARTNLYPALSLTGNLGSSSSALVSALSNPAAALGAGLALPFLQWQEMKLNARMARADYERAVLGFRQTFYRALGDVENALSQRRQLAAQAAYLDKALDTARRAERIAEVQYRAGSVPIKTWLDAQEARRGAAAALSAHRLERLSACVALYQALGGDAPAAGAQ